MQRLLEKVYNAEGRQPIPSQRVVVAGTTGEARLPHRSNADGILGVVTTPFGVRPIPCLVVRKAGLVMVEAAGEIAFGEPVNIADATGRVKRVDEPAGTPVNVVGFAESSATEEGDLIEVFLQFHQRVA